MRDGYQKPTTARRLLRQVGVLLQVNKRIFLTSKISPFLFIFFLSYKFISFFFVTILIYGRYSTYQWDRFFVYAAHDYVWQAIKKSRYETCFSSSTDLYFFSPSAVEWRRWTQSSHWAPPDRRLPRLDGSRWRAVEQHLGFRSIFHWRNSSHAYDIRNSSFHIVSWLTTPAIITNPNRKCRNTATLLTDSMKTLIR